MEREICFRITFNRPGRRTVLSLFFMFLMCMPAIADNIGVTTVKTYYPIAYGNHYRPTVSQRFEMKNFILKSGTNCMQASLVVSAPSVGNIYAKGGNMLFAGDGIELAPTGTSARVNIGANAHLSGFMRWVPISALPPSYSADGTIKSVGGPFWTPICNGTLTADTRAGICIQTSGVTATHRLFLKARVYFAKFEPTGLRLYIDSGCNTPTGGVTP